MIKKHQKEGWKFKYKNEKVCAFQKEGEKVWVEFIESEFGKPEEILRSFDFTVAKMAYYKEPKYEEKEDDYFPFSSTDVVGYEYKLLYHLKHKDVSFAISLTEHDRVQLLDDDSRKESGSETYYERECDALFDINGRGNTERLVVRNPKLRNLLKDGEYIPSLRQLNLMAHYKDSINDALKYIGAEPLASEWFWSSTESSQYNAWYVYFFIGDTGSYSKYGSGRVRAVIDF